MATIDSTPGGVNANSFLTHAEANTYFGNRIPLSPPWIASGQEAYIITATRLLCNFARPFSRFFPGNAGQPAYYRIRQQWTGLPATPTQRLAWPRLSMFDGQNNPIDSTIVPQDLKDATAEFAGQLLQGDRSLDNSVIVQGLNSIKAGSVALGFNKDIMPQVVPDSVLNLMPQSWLTDEQYVLANQAIFEDVSPDRTCEDRREG